MRYNLWLEQRYKEISEYLDSLPTEPIPEVGSERERANKTLFNNIASVVLKERIINSPMVSLTKF